MILAQMAKRYKALHILVVNSKGVRPWVEKAGITNPNHQEVK
jgi:hypothetical protein